MGRVHPCSSMIYVRLFRPHHAAFRIFLHHWNAKIGTGKKTSSPDRASEVRRRTWPRKFKIFQELKLMIQGVFTGLSHWALDVTGAVDLPLLVGIFRRKCLQCPWSFPKKMEHDAEGRWVLQIYGNLRKSEGNWWRLRLMRYKESAPKS